MLFANIDYLTGDYDVKTGFVGVEGARIVYVRESDPALDPAFGATDFGERYDGTGRLLMPGLYNAHAHAPMTLLRGYAENLPLQSWLNDKVFPFEAHINDERAYPAMQLAIAEMLRFGVVSFSDMYYFPDARARAVRESGIKCNMSNAVICFDDISYDEHPGKAEGDYMARTYHGACDGRLLVDLCIHTEFTTTPRIVEAAGQHAVDLGLRTHIHLSETRTEHEECKQRRGGLTPAAYFESLGFFRQPCSAAHCVWTEPADWEIFKRHDVTAVCNPASNMKLASGFAPIQQMLNAGVRVALGTDGVASNNNHNMFKDLYLFAMIYKGHSGDPTAITPAQALHAATRAGALAQGRDDCGAIAPGNRADLVVLNTNSPWMQPVNSKVNNLVYAAQGSDVCLTMVDGRVVYRDGHWPTIDVEQAAAATTRATRDILAEL